MSKLVTWREGRPPAYVHPRYKYKLADNPEWTVVGFEVSYPPDGATPPHKHGGASVIAQVLEGEVLSAMNDEEPKVYKPGDTWYEAPGCHHRISDNNSKTQGCRFIATFVIKSEVLEKEGLPVLVQIDEEYHKYFDGPSSNFAPVEEWGSTVLQ